MDYGHTAQNQSGEPSFFTAGVGNSPEDAPLSGQPNLESGIFLDEQDYSGRGNATLNASEVPNKIEPNSRATILPFPPQSEAQLGQISDAPTSQSSPYDYDIENSETIQRFKDGKASAKDVKELKEAINGLAQNENDSDNAAKIYEFRRATCEALDPIKEAA